MQDDLTNEIARVLVETQAATVENRALALRPLIAREVAAQKERDGFVLVPVESTDEICEAIASEANCCGGIADTIWNTAIAAAIRSAG